MSQNEKKHLPLLEVTDLHHQYDGKGVLTIEAWSLHQHEHQLLLGPSGSGKTTFMGILSGLLRPTRGQVNALNKSITTMGVSELSSFRAQNFGFVFQDHHLVSSLTVGENMILAHQLADQAVDEAWIDHLLDHLGLGQHKTSKPAELSHGEAQRAAIARAAVTRPPIILADEPTSALDDENASRVMDLLKTLSDEARSTMLVASHDSRIKPFFSRSLVLEKPEERKS